MPSLPTPNQSFNNPLLRLNGRCPTCRTPYDFQRLRILAEKEQSILAFLECGQCATSVLSLLHVGSNGLATHALITDLTPDEVYDRLDVSTSLTSDEVLDFHEFIEANDGIEKYVSGNVGLLSKMTDAE